MKIYYPSITGSCDISGTLFVLQNTTISGTLYSPQITGTLFGTSSFANSASFADSASYVIGNNVSGSVLSSSYALSASNALSSSYALSSSFATTASRAITSSITLAPWTLSGSTLYYTGGIVGINTFNPSGTLHIIARETGQSRTFILQQTASGVNQSRIEFLNSSGSGTNDGAAVFFTAPDYGSGYNSSFGVWNYQPGSIIFATANTERLRITSSGEVGIGTTTPVNKLDVVGSIRSTTSITGSNIWTSNLTASNNLFGNIIVASGSVNSVGIGRRDTGPVAWQLYSPNGELTLYESAISSNKYTFESGSNIFRPASNNLCSLGKSSLYWSSSFISNMNSSILYSTTVDGTYLYGDFIYGDTIYGQFIISSGSGNSVGIGRRDTGPVSWQLYSAAGELALYDNIGSVTKYIFESGSNVFRPNTNNLCSLGKSSLYWSSSFISNMNSSVLYSNILYPNFVYSPSITSELFISSGSANGYYISRRDTNASSWLLYSSAGELALYDDIGDTTKYIFESGSNVFRPNTNNLGSLGKSTVYWSSSFVSNVNASVIYTANITASNSVQVANIETTSVGSYFGVSRRDTNALCWQIYSSTGELILYETPAAANRYIFESGSNIFRPNTNNLCSLGKSSVYWSSSFITTRFGASISASVLTASFVGIGTSAQNTNNTLAVVGQASIGTTTYNTANAPTNGLIVEGKVGIGTTTPVNKLDVVGNISASVVTASVISGSSFTGTSSYASNISGGSVNYIPIWSGSSTLSSSILYQSSSRIGLGTLTPTASLEISTSNSTLLQLKGTGGNNILNISGSGNIGIGIAPSPSYVVQISGSFSATSKSFIIDHKTKLNKKLVHGSLEGPEHGVYIRGKINSNIIELPDYWEWLIDKNTITVNLTSIGKYQELFVDKIENNKIYINNNNGIDINAYYTVYAERIDINKLELEI